jgi:MarR family transcriptional regulator, organic hydroperoxide resistance regulator
VRLTYPDTIPFMLHLISARNVAEATDEFIELGLNVQNARVMIVALLNPGITPRWLSEITRIDSSALTYMLNRLSAEGLIVRRKLKTDGRSVAIDLTAKGRRLARDCYQASVEHERRMIDGLSPQEAELFRAATKKMFSRLAVGTPTLIEDEETRTQHKRSRTRTIERAS